MPASDDYRRADAIVDAIPEALRDLARDREAVMPLLLALLLAGADDVLEFLSAGAVAVQVGSQNLVDPFACKTIVETLPPLLQAYGIPSVSSIIGRAHHAT